ncbi:MAG: hypothetical protein EXS13_02465 [Planctomycetes bacterium]|nr:hypothetical protein [Planctomycetota bacterium]
MSPVRSSLLTLVTTALFALLLAPPLRADELLQNGAKAPIRCTIESESVDTVKFRRDGATALQEIASAAVADITYDDAPKAFRNGRELLAAGDAENAANSFRLALRTKTRNDWIRVHGTYYLGCSLQALGARDATKLPEAAATFAGLLGESPNCRFMPDALRRHADVLAATNNVLGAAALYDRLAQVARDHKLGVVAEARARLLKADAFAAADMTREAEASYLAATRFAEASAGLTVDRSIRRDLQALAGRAKLAPGDALLRHRQFAAARAFFAHAAQDGAAAQGDGALPEVVAAAQNGVGEALLAEGRAREALAQFAQVRVAHYLVREQTARATYFLGKSILALNNAEPNGKKKAADYFAEVVLRYSETPWADRARLEIR